MNLIKDELVIKCSCFYRSIVIIPNLFMLYHVMNSFFSEDIVNEMIRVVIGSIIWFGVWFPFTFQFLRTIVIDQAGVKVQCLFYKKYYTWNQFKVIRMEKHHYSDNYGMFFLSEHLVKRKTRETVRGYCAWKRPFDTLFVEVLPQDCSGGKIRDDLMWSMGLHVGYYDFMEKLRQWEIEFEEVLVEYSFEGF